MLYELENVSHRYTARSPLALADINLQIQAGERIAIVGASGSGKSTLLNILLALTTPSAGTVKYQGQLLAHDGKTTHNKTLLRQLRASTGVVFQDPQTSFNPLLTVGTSILENAQTRYRLAHPDAPPRTSEQLRQDAIDLATELGLDAQMLDRYPHEFSGGQRQRLAIVRALIARPHTLVADEPVSSLDVLSRGKFIETLQEVAHSRKLTLLTVTHDLSIVPHLAERTLQLENGKLQGN